MSKYRVSIKNEPHDALSVYSFRASKEDLERANELGIDLPETFRDALSYAITLTEKNNTLLMEGKKAWKKKKAP